jgi:regulator of protease activity HflC (stomatin/prohibitin superfamily)
MSIELTPKIIVSGVFLGCCASWIVISVFLIGFSFSIIEVEEYGVLYSTYMQELKNETRTSGRYFTGLGKTFKKFPRRYNSVDFSETDGSIADALSCFTNEGLGVYVDLSFYYRLEKDLIRDMYLTFGDYWFANIVRKSYASIKEICPKYKTTEFFSKREEIATEMKDYIQENFEEVFGGAVVVESLQLRNLDFDEPLEEAITNKLIQEINLRVYEIRMDATQIEKEKNLIENWAENNITLINAEAEVLAIGQTEYAKADALNLILSQMASSYGSLNSELGLLADQELIQFIHASELAELAETLNNKLYFGLNDPVMFYWGNSQSEESPGSTFSDSDSVGESDVESDEESDGESDGESDEESDGESDGGAIDTDPEFSDYSGLRKLEISMGILVLINLLMNFF